MMATSAMIAVMMRMIGFASIAMFNSHCAPAQISMPILAAPAAIVVATVVVVNSCKAPIAVKMIGDRADTLSDHSSITVGGIASRCVSDMAICASVASRVACS